MNKTREIPLKNDLNGKRNSSIELLKIISLFLITVQHVLTTTNFQFGMATENYGLLIGNFFRYSGILGNIIFVICSSFFLIESDKNNYSKIIHILIDTVIISLIWLMVLFFAHIKLPMQYILRSFMPTTLNNNWFVSCYILFYLFHPFMNMIISHISKEQHFRIVFFLIVLYCGIQFIKNNVFFYNELIGFIVIYFIVAYYKKYLVNNVTYNKLNKYILIFSLLSNILLMIFTNYLGLRYSIFSNKLLYWNHNLCNPFSLLTGLSLFHVFCKRSYYINLINKISSVSLIYYLIHENILFRTFVRKNIFDFFTNTFNLILACIILIFLIFIMGIILSLIYKNTIQQLIYKLIDKIYLKVKNKYLNIERKIVKYL